MERNHFLAFIGGHRAAMGSLARDAETGALTPVPLYSVPPEVDTDARAFLTAHEALLVEWVAATGRTWREAGEALSFVRANAGWSLWPDELVRAAAEFGRAVLLVDDDGPFLAD